MGTSAFEVIVKQQIKRLEEPSQRCCQLVYDELIRILGQLLNKIVRKLRGLLGFHAQPVFQQTLKRYPALKDSLNAVVVSFFKNAMQPTTKLVSDMVS